MNISIFGVLRDVLLKRKNAFFRALPELPPPLSPQFGQLVQLVLFVQRRNQRSQDLQISFNRTKILYIL